MQLLSQYSGNLVTQFISFVGEELVDFPDFLALIAKSVQDTDSHDELREAFKAFDKNGDDIIDAAELRLVMSKLGEQLTDAEINEMIQTADRDGDGQVHYEGTKVFTILKTKYTINRSLGHHHVCLHL